MPAHDAREPEIEPVDGAVAIAAPIRTLHCAEHVLVRRQRRLISLVVLIASTGLLGLAAWLEPAEAGVGTHEQLNLPECGWVVMMDLPCPTCGMTTAFAHAANGSILKSFKTQPMGAALAVATAMALLISGYVAITGSALWGLFRQMWTRWSIWYIAAFAAAAWIYKILSHRGML